MTNQNGSLYLRTFKKGSLQNSDIRVIPYHQMHTMRLILPLQAPKSIDANGSFKR
jgi:hypothetical protein